MKAPSPDLSVIIVNWNGGTLVLEVLRNLLETTSSLNLEVLLVDNASTDESPQQIQELFPGVRFIQMDQNVGFCKGNNRALQEATGKAILLLNPDAVPEVHAIPSLLLYLNEHPQVGAVGPRLQLSDGTLDAACRRHFKTIRTYFYRIFYLDRLFPKSRRFGHYNLTYLDPSVLTEVDGISGACFLVRKSALDSIGVFFDEQFLMYCEDEDWCYRLKAAGWKIMYYPQALVTHYKGFCSTSHSSWKTRLRVSFYWHRAIWLFHRKHMASQHTMVLNGLVYLSIVLHGFISSIRSLVKGSFSGSVKRSPTTILMNESSP